MKKLTAIAISTFTVLAISASATQPNMTKAMEHLEQVKMYLKKAKKNKGGHRSNAIKSVNKAMKQVQKGIKHAEKKK